MALELQGPEFAFDDRMRRLVECGMEPSARKIDDHEDDEGNSC